MANEIYNKSWWGNPVKDGFGGVYYDLSYSALTREYEERVIADNGIIESLSCVQSNL